MSYYPAEKIVDVHRSFDVPVVHSTNSVLVKKVVLSHADVFVKTCFQITILALWTIAIYCLIKGFYLFFQWTLLSLQYYAKKQKDELEASSKFTPKSNKTSSSSSKAFSSLTSFNIKSQSDVDLESQNFSGSVTPPELSYTPSLSSPSSIDSPPFSATATHFLTDTYQRVNSKPTIELIPSEPLPAPKSFSSVNIIDPFDARLVSSTDHPMIKIH